MSADSFHREAAADLRNGAAVIHPVTPEVLDDVAHKAARLADGVAHHTVDLGGIHRDAIAQAWDEAVPPASTTARSLEHVAADADEAARDRAVDPVGRAVEGAEPAAAPLASAAEGGLLGPADAFSRYNALVVQMVRSYMAATGDLFAALVQARSVPEAVAINAGHLRRRLDVLTSQGREFADLAQTLTLDALRPFTAANGRGR